MNEDTRHGRQTPTISVILPYESTKGAEAVELYNATEKDALEWQEVLCYDIMATDGISVNDGMMRMEY